MGPSCYPCASHQMGKGSPTGGRREKTKSIERGENCWEPSPRGSNPAGMRAKSPRSHLSGSKGGHQVPRRRQADSKSCRDLLASRARSHCPSRTRGWGDRTNGMEGYHKGTNSRGVGVGSSEVRVDFFIRTSEFGPVKAKSYTGKKRVMTRRKARVEGGNRTAHVYLLNGTGGGGKNTDGEMRSGPARRPAGLGPRRKPQISGAGMFRSQSLPLP